MHDDFLHYLKAEGVLPADQTQWAQHPRRQPAEPIGSIAFSHGLLTGEDVDRILDRQRHSRRPFGEIAVEMGILDHRQIDRLLEIQKLRSTIAMAEAIILTGVCPPEEVISRLGRFLFGRYGRTIDGRQPTLPTEVATSS